MNLSLSWQVLRVRGFVGGGSVPGVRQRLQHQLRHQRHRAGRPPHRAQAERRLHSGNRKAFGVFNVHGLTEGHLMHPCAAPKILCSSKGSSLGVMGWLSFDGWAGVRELECG